MSVWASAGLFAERVGSRSAKRAVRRQSVIDKRAARLQQVPSNLRIVAESDDENEDDDLAPRRLNLDAADGSGEDDDL